MSQYSHASSREQSVTPFQKNLSKLVQKQRDFAIEVLIPGEEAADLCSNLLSILKRSPAAVKAAIISTDETLCQFYDQILKKARTRRHALLNDKLTAKTEFSVLSGKPDIIISSARRLIDHLRAGTLNAQALQYLVINTGSLPADQALQQDLAYIFSKVPSGVQKLFVSSNLSNFEAFLKPRTAVIKSADFARIAENAYAISDALVPPALLAQGLSRLHSSPVLFSGNPKLPKDHYAGLRVLPLQDLGKTSEASSLILIQVPNAVSAHALLDLVRNQARVYFLVAQDSLAFINSLKEKTTVKKPSIQNEDLLKAQIKEIMRLVRREEDPYEITEYKKFFNKNVSIFMRGYFAAYCVKYFLKNVRATTERKPTFERKPAPAFREREREREKPIENARVAEPVMERERPAESVGAKSGKYQTLFVSIGKNRKVFPRDLSRLFSQALSVKPEELGEINIFDKYSFIDIPTALAPKAIETLNGDNFRGRKIVVNYARKRDNEA